MIQKKSIIVPILKDIKFKELKGIHQRMLLKVFLKSCKVFKTL